MRRLHRPHRGSRSGAGQRRGGADRRAGPGERRERSIGVQSVDAGLRRRWSAVAERDDQALLGISTTAPGIGLVRRGSRGRAGRHAPRSELALEWLGCGSFRGRCSQPPPAAAGLDVGRWSDHRPAEADRGVVVAHGFGGRGSPSVRVDDKNGIDDYSWSPSGKHVVLALRDSTARCGQRAASHRARPLPVQAGMWRAISTRIACISGFSTWTRSRWCSSRTAITTT